MKKINYHLYYKNGYYVLLNRNDLTYVKRLGFYDIYSYIKQKNIPFDTVGMPRLTLDKLFRDYCYYPEKGGNRI